MTDEQPVQRIYPKSPLPAVSAVIFNHHNQILLIRRGSEPAKDLWSFPGGVVQLGESLEEALHREVEEECAVEIKVLCLLDVLSRIFKEANLKIRYHYIILDYLCEYHGGKLNPGSDAADARWIAPSGLKEMRLAEGVYAMIEKGKHKMRNLA